MKLIPIRYSSKQSNLSHCSHNRIYLKWNIRSLVAVGDEWLVLIQKLRIL